MQLDDSLVARNLLAIVTVGSFAMILAVAPISDKNWFLAGGLAVLAIGLPIQVSAWHVARYHGVSNLTTFGRVWLGIALVVLPIGLCALLLSYSLWATFLFIASVYGSGFAFMSGACTRKSEGFAPEPEGRVKQPAPTKAQRG